MLERVVRVVRCQGTRMAAVAVTTGAVCVIGPASAAAAADARTVVNCKDNPAALRTAIAGAGAGETLGVKGTCIGPFTIARNLTVVGLKDAVLDGNYASSAVAVTGAVRVHLTHLTIAHGTGTVVNGQVFGGGILNNAGGTVALTDSTVRNNAAQFGGGIANLAVGGGTVTVTRSRVRNNMASISAGGIFVGQNSTLALSDSTVQDNHAQFGGGILNDAGGRVTLSGSAVRSNSATANGGGISNLQGSTLTLIDSRVERNTTGDGPGSGGGILNLGTVASAQSTVRDNNPDNCAPAGSVGGCTG